jgi:hypothetical protein
LVLVFMVAVLAVFAADAVLPMDALLGDNLGFSVIPYFPLTLSSFLATADDDVDTPEDKDVKPAVVVFADAVLDILALAVAELAGLAVSDGKGDSTGDEFKSATVVVVVVRGGGGNASGSGSVVVADAVVAVLAMVGFFVFIFVVTGEALALALALAVAELLEEAVTDFEDGDFFRGDFTALVLVALGF